MFYMQLKQNSSALACDKAAHLHGWPARRSLPPELQAEWKARDCDREVAEAGAEAAAAEEAPPEGSEPARAEVFAESSRIGQQLRNFCQHLSNFLANIWCVFGCISTEFSSKHFCWSIFRDVQNHIAEFSEVPHMFHNLPKLKIRKINWNFVIGIR